MPETLGGRGSVVNRKKDDSSEVVSSYVPLEHDEIMQTRTID
jgi:hypothetical protein